MKLTARFFVAVLGAVLLAASVFLWRYPAAEARRAIVISAVVALVVQGIAYGIVRLSSQKNVIAAWGLGSLLRFGSLALYGLLLVPALGLPGTPALLSLAVFLFLTTLLEPLFLTP